MGHLCCGIIAPMTERHRSLVARTAPVLLIVAAACGPEPAKPAPSNAAPAATAAPAPPPALRVYVTNEASGDLTVINGDTQAVMATAPLVA